MSRLHPLTERDWEVLGALLPSYSDELPGWNTPLALGARDSSHHSKTLAKLVRHGLAEVKQRWCEEGVVTPRQRIDCGRRGSKEYRITPRGIVIYRERFGLRLTREESRARMLVTRGTLRKIREARDEATHSG